MISESKRPLPSPTRWNVEENVPPIRGMGFRILVDGEEIQRVVAFDVEEGWVRKLCEGERPGHSEEPHVSPDDETRVCEAPLLRGAVSILPPVSWSDHEQEEMR